MAEIKWVTPIATATAIAESKWKRELEKVSVLFELWRKQHPHDTELDWLFYSGRQGIRSRPARHVWDMYRTTRKTGTPYEQSLKKPKKTKKVPMTYLPPEKLDTSHRQSYDWISIYHLTVSPDNTLCYRTRSFAENIGSCIPC